MFTCQVKTLISHVFKICSSFNLPHMRKLHRHVPSWSNYIITKICPDQSIYEVSKLPTSFLTAKTWSQTPIIYQLDKFIALLPDLQTLSFTNKTHLLLLARVIFKFINYITLLLFLKPCVAWHCTMSEMLTSSFDLVNVLIPFCLVSPSSPGTALFSTSDALFSHAFWS